MKEFPRRKIADFCIIRFLLFLLTNQLL